MTQPLRSISLLLSMSFLFSCSKMSTAPLQEPANEFSDSYQRSHKHAEYAKDQARFKRESGNPRTYDVEKYALQARFDWERLVLKARMNITLRLIQSTQTIELDSMLFTVNSVNLRSGTTQKKVRFTQDLSKGLLTVDLRSTRQTKPGSEIILSIDYETPANWRKETASAQEEEDATGYEFGGLRAVNPRPGDPVQSRVVFTFSEPQGAPTWMPCNDRPGDRAHFSMEMELPEDHRLISNGDLVLDDVRSEKGKPALRKMRYETHYPLPTYLMAFALGEFVTATQWHGQLPVSIWARKGLSVDWSGLLETTVQQITHFETLLTPYPFEKYAVVLLPEFGGGIEHASITFNNEEYSSQSKVSGDVYLMAHELGHQWYGDYATIENWDDLWIKEGMASLLAIEYGRFIDDQSQTGRLMADGLEFNLLDAIMDPELSPEDKYTSGPYDRAAWYLTQVRKHVGEKAFWATMRGLLTKNAFGTLNTNQVLSAFQPQVDGAFFEKMKKALTAHTGPQINIEKIGQDIAVGVTDPHYTLLSPITLRFDSVSGNHQTLHLSSGEVGHLVAADRGLWSFDPEDVHPDVSTFFNDSLGTNQDKWSQLFTPLGAPVDALTSKLFMQTSVSHQEFSLGQFEHWSMLPSYNDFQRIAEGLSSDTARVSALRLACSTLTKSDPRDAMDSWKEFVRTSLLNLPLLGLDGQTRLSGCTAETFPWEAVTSDLEILQKNPGAESMTDTKVRFLSMLPLPSEKILATWKNVAWNGSTHRSRKVAFERLSSALKSFAWEEQPEDKKSAWLSVVTEGLMTFRTRDIVTVLLAMARQTQEPKILPSLLEVLRYGTLHPSSPKGYAVVALSPAVLADTVCTARKLSQNESLWAQFVQGTAGLRLPQSARERLNKPELCN